VTVGAQLVMVYTIVVEIVRVVVASPEPVPVAVAEGVEEVSVSVTGQTVVYRSIVSVTTLP